jgi:hypothetical protein
MQILIVLGYAESLKQRENLSWNTRCVEKRFRHIKYGSAVARSGRGLT